MSKISRVAVAGLRGDSGKTLVSIGLAHAYSQRNLKVAPFKKGPDYIDAAWLSLATNQTCRNLDTFLMEEDVILASWERGLVESDIAVLEGNRGLYDGMDAHGSHSTAALCKLIDCPVLLVLDVTKMTRTTAAIVKGVQAFDADVNLMGVVLNRVAGKRHEKVIRDAIHEYTGLPVLGSIPKLKEGSIPSRHLGLITTDDHPEALKAVQFAAEVMQDHVDLERIRALGTYESKSKRIISKDQASKDISSSDTLMIGVIRDAAFPFYYPENLEELKFRGAELVEISILENRELPVSIDALYIGGGFPETHAERLSQQRVFLDSIKRAAEEGLPIYAECGGLILLARSLQYEGKSYPMAGVLPVDIGWQAKPAGHGYSYGTIDKDNPFYPDGTVIKGHEFHYSLISNPDDEYLQKTALSLAKGSGVGAKRDGIVYKNALALYTHVHAAGLPAWGDGMLRAAEIFKKSNNY
ncbi:cobyrinate a,c-diamide synthase [bacterium]|nr:cobyrinate a,c-diamide synthase [bacterium]